MTLHRSKAVAQTLSRLVPKLAPFALGIAVSFSTEAPDSRYPVIAALNPASFVSGQGGVNLLIEGTNFVPGAVVRWNGIERTTSYLGPTQLSAGIPATDVAAAGYAQVAVMNPPPGGGLSFARVVTIANPIPTLSNLSNAGAQAGAAGFPIAILGSGFAAGATVRWNGVDRPSAVYSSTVIAAELADSDLAAAGTAQITVVNPGPGGGSSAPLSFSIRSENDTPGPSLSVGTAVAMNGLPASAEIVFVAGLSADDESKQIFTMDRYGRNTTQITLGSPRHYDQVAVSRDRRYIAAAEHFDVMQPPKLWLFDLQARTEKQVAPEWISAGFGRIDWDSRGFLYFGGVPYNLAQGGTSNHNDLFRVRHDGTGLQRLIRTDDENDGDVDVSSDSTTIAYTKEYLVGLPGSYTEIWRASTDGSNPRLVIKGGVMGVSNIQNPAFSPDGTKIAFDRRNDNPSVPPNFTSDGNANAAHDLWIVKSSGGSIPPDPADPGNPTDPNNASGYAVRVTKEGPISILPSWRYVASGSLRGNLLLYLNLCECPASSGPYGGSAIVFDGAMGKQEPIRVKLGAQSARWIP